MPVIRERRNKLHDGQCGCWKRRSAVDAVAVLMNRTQQAWQGKKVAGALLMDVKAAFNSVNRTILSRRLGELGIEPDLVRCTYSFMSDRRVKLVLEGRDGGEHEVETGVPQGSPVAPILFTAYLSGVFDHVEEACPGIHGALLRCGMVGGREVGEGSGGGFGQGGGNSAGLGSGQWGNIRPREDGSHVPVQATKEAYGIGTGRGARSPLQSTCHAVARSLDRL